jgi:hypothetical protein
MRVLRKGSGTDGFIVATEMIFMSGDGSYKAYLVYTDCPTFF